MWEEIQNSLLICLFKRNPCRNCIVQGCCSEVCDQSRKFNHAIDHNTPVLQRISAWLLVISIFVGIPWVIFNIYNS